MNLNRLTKEQSKNNFQINQINRKKNYNHIKKIIKIKISIKNQNKHNQKKFKKMYFSPHLLNQQRLIQAHNPLLLETKILKLKNHFQ